MTSILYIGNKLSKHGLSVSNIETLGKSLEEEGFLLFYASDKKNKIFRLLEMIWKTIIYYKKVDYLLIDTYSTSNFWYAFVISQLSRVFRIKYIPILHGGNLPHRLKQNPKFSNLIFKNAYINVVPSNYLYSSFQKFGYTNLIHIPNSINLKQYQLHIKNFDNPNILWVRAIDTIYNPEMAINVFAKVKEKYPKATLCMVGGEKNLTISHLQKIANKLQVEVTFTGKLSKSDWITLSKEYNVFINTTHVDNTPVSVIEAAALGFPIVSTNVGGLPFLLKHNENALLVNDNAVDDMAISIIQIIENDILRSKLITNSLHLSNSFDWQVVKSDWIKILK